MKVDVSEMGSYQRKLTVVVPPAEVREKLDRAYRNLSRQVRLPGFRPGKAPRRVLEARYGETIEADVAQELIQKSWTDILAQGELDPVGRPNVDESGSVADVDGFRFTISVDVRPEIGLQKWTQVQVVHPKVQVDDEQVEASVKARLEGHAKLEEVTDRPCQAGDLALAEVQVLDEGEVVLSEPGTMIRTEGDPYFPGMEGLLIGLELGGEAEGTIDFADGARNEAIAGRTLTAHVKLQSVQSYRVPELSDALAGELGFDGGAAGMRQAVREELVRRLDEASRNQARANVLEAIIDANDFEVPDGMIESSLEMLMQELRQQQAYQTGRDPRTIGFSDVQVADLRSRAIFAAKASLILEWVGKQESIEVTDADLERRYQELAEDRGQAVEAVKGMFAKESAVDELRERVLEEKTLDWLLDHAKVVDEVVAPRAKVTKKTTSSADHAILKGSIGDLRDALASGYHDGELQAMLEAEKAGRARKGAVAAIESRIADTVA